MLKKVKTSFGFNIKTANIIPIYEHGNQTIHIGLTLTTHNSLNYLNIHT